MNKVLKGLVAVAATAAMAIAGVAGASTAMAADPTGGIKVADGDTHTYSVYQIFTGTYGTDGSLGNVAAGKNFNTMNKAGTSGADLTAAEAAKTVSELNNSVPNSEKLETINKFVDLGSVAFGTVSSGSNLPAPAGYYLAKDSETVTGDDAATLYIVKVVGNQVVTITRKVAKPTFQKKVKDVNDSTGEGNVWQDSADYDVKDKVAFQLTATLPTSKADFAAYKTYKLVFKDTQSAGLTYPEATGFTVKYENTVVPANQYTLTLNPTTTTADSTFTLTINDVKTLKDVAGSEIQVAADGKFTVEYESTLNDKAVIGHNGNPNKASLEFSNNPNYTGEGESSPTGEGESSPTGETPEDKVIVFTYQLNVNKTFDQGAPAEGDMPQFKLYKKNSAGNYDPVGEEITLSKGGTEAAPTYTGSFPRIDDGDYKLVESHTPAGYNTAADTLFTVTADHDVLSDNPTLISLKINQTDGDKTNGTVQANVVNKKGSNLPATGGMGTTILYAAGAAIVLVAAFGIAFAVRRRNAR